MSQRGLLHHILCLVAITGIWATTDRCDEGSGDAATTNVTASVACTTTSTLYPSSMFPMTDLPSSSFSLVIITEVFSPILSPSAIPSESDFPSISIQPSLIIYESLMPTVSPSSTIPTMTQSSSLMATTSTMLFVTTTQSSLATATMIQSSMSISTMTTATQSSLMTGTTNQSLLPSTTQTLAISISSSVMTAPSSPSPATTTDIPVRSTPPSTMTFGVSSSLSPSPTTSSDSVWNAVSEYLMTPGGLAVVIGGPVIMLLVIIIIVIVCCYCCVCRKTRGKFDIGSEKYANGNLYNGQRVSNTDPQDIQMTLKKVQMERHLITQSAGASFAENEEMDDSLHYQGHSQIQHSQMYSQVLAEGLGTAGSLPKLTPIRPSQIISQVQVGQISVDDDDENGESIPVKDKHSHTRMLPLDDDSPFMHLSDNLSRHSSKSRIIPDLNDNLSRHSSKSRIIPDLNDTPLDQVVALTGTQHSQFQDTSQMSYLGLGVRHASDIVLTNTASLLEEGDSTGLSTLGLERSSASHIRHSSASPLLSADNMLDDTPERDKPTTGETSAPRTSGKPTNFALLTSLSSDADAPVKDTPSGDKGPEEQGSSSEATAANPGKKMMSLGAMTSLPSKLESQGERLTASVEVPSEAPEGPERQRSRTLASSNPTNFSRTSRNTKLGRLTSLEYIRASLRKRLSTMKSKDGHEKKPLKSALRKTGSVSSTSSNESTPNHQPPQGLTYVNRYTTHYDEFGGRDMSPHPVNYPPHMTSPDMMGSFDVPPVGYTGGAVGYMGGSLPYGGREPYGYSGPPQLSPAMGYGHELSPILSVPFDYMEPQYRHEIGIFPPYGVPMSMMEEQFPIPAASQYDDDDLPVLANPYRHGGVMGGGPSQGQSQRVTWNLDHEEIPPRTPVDPEELTPSDIDDHEIA